QIRGRLASECDKLLTDEVRSRPLFIHPGGLALMKVIADHYPDLGDSARCSLSVLEQNGNVGSPSVLFVLSEALRRGLPFTPSLQVLGIGPGMVMTLARFHDTSVA